MTRWLPLLVFSLSLPLSLSAAEPAATVKLWPGKAPGETKDIGPEKFQAGASFPSGADSAAPHRARTGVQTRFPGSASSRPATPGRLSLPPITSI